MLYLLAAASILYASNAVSTTSRGCDDQCDRSSDDPCSNSGTNSQGCYRDAYLDSNNYGCDICQDSDPCSGTENPCDPDDADSCANYPGYICQGFINYHQNAGSAYPYKCYSCVPDTTTTTSPDPTTSRQGTTRIDTTTTTTNAPTDTTRITQQSTSSSTGCPPCDTDSCPNGAACYYDGDEYSDTFECFTCQDYDPCSDIYDVYTYCDFNDPDSCQALGFGQNYECIAEYLSPNMWQCPYCEKFRDTTTTATQSTSTGHSTTRIDTTTTTKDGTTTTTCYGCKSKDDCEYTANNVDYVECIFASGSNADGCGECDYCYGLDVCYSHSDCDIGERCEYSGMAGYTGYCKTCQNKCPNEECRYDADCKRLNSANLYEYGRCIRDWTNTNYGCGECDYNQDPTTTSTYTPTDTTRIDTTVIVTDPTTTKTTRDPDSTTTTKKISTTRDQDTTTTQKDDTTTTRDDHSTTKISTTGDDTTTTKKISTTRDQDTTTTKKDDTTTTRDDDTTTTKDKDTSTTRDHDTTTTKMTTTRDGDTTTTKDKDTTTTRNDDTTTTKDRDTTTTKDRDTTTTTKDRDTTTTKTREPTTTKECDECKDRQDCDANNYQYVMCVKENADDEFGCCDYCYGVDTCEDNDDCKVVYSDAAGSATSYKSGICTENDFGCKVCKYECDGDDECTIGDDDGCDESETCEQRDSTTFSDDTNCGICVDKCDDDECYYDSDCKDETRDRQGECDKKDNEECGECKYDTTTETPTTTKTTGTRTTSEEPCRSDDDCKSGSCIPEDELDNDASTNDGTSDADGTNTKRDNDFTTTKERDPTTTKQRDDTTTTTKKRDDTSTTKTSTTTSTTEDPCMDGSIDCVCACRNNDDCDDDEKCEDNECVPRVNDDGNGVEMNGFMVGVACIAAIWSWM